MTTAHAAQGSFVGCVSYKTPSGTVQVSHRHEVLHHLAAASAAEQTEKSEHCHHVYVHDSQSCQTVCTTAESSTWFSLLPQCVQANAAKPSGAGKHVAQPKRAAPGKAQVRLDCWNRTLVLTI